MAHSDTGLNRESFEANPTGFLEKAIKEYVAQSPGNRLETFGGDPIFDEPLIGFADGDDTIFQDYKTIIGDFHLTPREVLEKHLVSRNGKQSIANVSVISFILPISQKTRLSMHQETVVASLRWNHTRWHGQDFINELSRYVVSLLESLDHQAVAPGLADFFVVKDFPSGRASNWSERHIAYAAGLGTFSLSDGFITPRGIAMRCGSVVTDAKLPPSPRPYIDYRANCLFYLDGTCRSCIERCPAEAISEQGHDKNKCKEFIYTKETEILKELGREEEYIGRFVACGLCQTKVPCEAKIPPKIPSDNRRKK